MAPNAPLAQARHFRSVPDREIRVRSLRLHLRLGHHSRFHHSRWIAEVRPAVVQLFFPRIDQPGLEMVEMRCQKVFVEVMDQSEFGEVGLGPVIERAMFVQRMDQHEPEVAGLRRTVGPEPLVRWMYHSELRRDEARLLVQRERAAALRYPPEWDFEVEVVAGWKQAVAFERLNG